MNRVTVRTGALAALSAMLIGCASAPAVNGGTLHSDTLQKDDPSVTLRPLGTPTNIEGAVKQAQALRKSGDFSAAARTLSQLVLFAPDDARVVGEYGKTLVAMGRSDDALAFLERAVELQPKDWSLFSAQGVAYDQKGEYLAAQAAYGRALVLKPGDPTVLSNAALSHVQTGDLDGAEALLMQASPHGAEFPRIVSNLALVHSLRNSRPPKAPSVAAPKEPAPVPRPTQAQAPRAPEAPVATPSTMPAPTASTIAIAPQPASVAEMPAVRAGDLAATGSALKRLQMDPSVLVQPLPLRRPDAVAKPKPTGVRPSTPSDALKSEPVLLRPTPDDDKPSAIRPKPRNAKGAGSKAAFDNGAPAPEPLAALRPAEADAQATIEASARR